MKLIIFDLDQTLVDLGQLHNEVTHRLLKEFFGVEAWLTEVEHSGRSQRDGLRHLATLKGVPQAVFEDGIDALLAEFGTEFATNMPPDISNHVLPGAAELLDTLSRTEHRVALYTGDAPGVVEAVLQATGLGHYFASRFSGTQFDSREDMVRAVIRDAETATGQGFQNKNVVIIGDALRDITCGRAVNAFTIGVATGYYSTLELAKAGADLVVGSLRRDGQIMLAAIEAPDAGP
jgi:phosphoglycolate phosphatase